MENPQYLLAQDQEITLKQDSYRVISKIGAGGYGSVWKVKRHSDSKILALKTINPIQSHNQYRSWRSLGEIQNLIDYANKEILFLEQLGTQAAEHFIIPMLDHGDWTHDDLPDVILPVFVMPFYGEGDLSRYCKAYPQSRSYTAHLFLQWAEQIAKALSYLHAQHNDGKPAIHRDIKPANVLLNAQGDAGLMDFGIARLSSGTGTTTSAYSRHFCAPEQLLAIYKTTQGHNRYLLTPALDIYSLGILLHELLTGSTHAQTLLSTSTVVEGHNQHLPLTDSGQFNAVGRLGKVGGLNNAEQEHLQGIVEALFDPPDNNATLIGGSSSQLALPLTQHLAQRYVSLQQRMLAAWPHDRPSAQQLVHSIQQLKHAFNPSVSHLSIKAADNKLTLDKPLRITISIQGQGLTYPAEWLRFEVNHRIQSAIALEHDFGENNAAQATALEEDWLYNDTQQHHMTATLPITDQVGEYLVNVFVQTPTQPHKASITLNLVDEHTPSIEVPTTDEAESSTKPFTQAPADDFDIITPQKSQTPTQAPILPTQPTNDPQQTTLIGKLKAAILFLPLPLASATVTFAVTYFAYTHYIAPTSSQKNSTPSALDASIIPSVVHIKGGSYLQGCVKGRDVLSNQHCDTSEPKGHKVSVKPFSIAKYEVTVAQYSAFVEATQRPKPPLCWGVTREGQWKKSRSYYWENTGFKQNKEHPVACVNIQDAQAYTAWLSKKTGQTWRLPTEKEWEYAARAGGNAAYFWGSPLKNICDYANGTDHSVTTHYPHWRSYDCNDDYVFTAPVATYQPNAWGLYDMAGNVWELTTDCYQQDNCTVDADRSRRGGSWSSNLTLLRSATRYKIKAADRIVDVGFRVVREH